MPPSRDREGRDTAAGRSKTVQSVDRAVALLRVLAEADAPVALKTLASKCELETPTAWRLLWTLQTHGLVEKAEPSHNYRLGFAALELSSSQAVDSLARVGRPLLERLASELEVTASLAYVERFGVVYIDQVEGPRFSSPHWKGRAISMHGSSPGKAVLAALSPQEVKGMVGPTLEALTDTTITDLKQLTAELSEIQSVGYAVCQGEDITYSNGASAVVIANHRPLAAIDLWGPERLVPTSRFAELGSAAKAAAAELAELLNLGPHR